MIYLLYFVVELEYDVYEKFFLFDYMIDEWDYEIFINRMVFILNVVDSCREYLNKGLFVGELKKFYRGNMK